MKASMASTRVGFVLPPAQPVSFFLVLFFSDLFFLNAKSGSLMIYYSVALGIHILYKSIGNGASTQACEKISDFWYSSIFVRLR